MKKAGIIIALGGLLVAISYYNIGQSRVQWPNDSIPKTDVEGIGSGELDKKWEGILERLGSVL